MLNIQVGDQSQWWGILCVLRVCVREWSMLRAFTVYIKINGVMALVLRVPAGKPRGCVLLVSAIVSFWAILKLEDSAFGCAGIVAEFSRDWSMSAAWTPKLYGYFFLKTRLNQIKWIIRAIFSLFATNFGGTYWPHDRTQVFGTPFWNQKLRPFFFWGSQWLQVIRWPLWSCDTFCFISDYKTLLIVGVFQWICHFLFNSTITVSVCE